MFSPVPIRASSDCSFPPPPNIQKNAAISAMSGQMNSRANKIELHNKVVERLYLYLCITALKGITMNNIFERDLKGEMVSPSDTGYDELINSIWKTMKTAAELNDGYHTPTEVRRILGEIIGQKVDESVTLLPPFYVDYGKHIKIGKGFFIQQCCTFFGRGGITLGENVLVGPKVNIITINHDPDPENRSATYGRPIVIEDKVWIGINATILPGVKIGYGAIIGANSVVTKDVPPMTVVAGNPARIIKKLPYQSGNSETCSD